MNCHHHYIACALPDLDAGIERPSVRAPAPKSRSKLIAEDEAEKACSASPLFAMALMVAVVAVVVMMMDANTSNPEAGICRASPALSSAGDRSVESSCNRVVVLPYLR
jgi:hypothetical protein